MGLSLDDRHSWPESARRLFQQLSAMPRYELIGFLGQGAFGLVFEALDRERDARVALKVLYREERGALVRFKNEFRALADITHPSLVMLFDLTAHDETWFLTMELVENSVSFLDHVWRTPKAPAAATRTVTASATEAASASFFGSGATQGDPSTLDRPRLRDAMRQLVQGIAALHRARRLHRDLKPSNVLVGADGRLVILDFGMVGDLSEAAAPLKGIVGTPGYIAPELFRGEPASEASDWYAVGAMLHEALTGRLPPRGSGQRPAPIGKDDDDDDDDDKDVVMHAICRALLADDPNERPTGVELLVQMGRLLGEHEQTSSAVDRGLAQAPSTTPFVGRSNEQATLRAALAKARGGELSGVILAGASGVGKSALVRHFLDDVVRVVDSNAVVLAGRCYERESVPYKAIDEVIDALAQYLHSLSDVERHALCPPHMRALARLFPVLRALSLTCGASSNDDASPEALDARELRHQAFGALKMLLARIATKRTVVVSIDDMQWGDPDSMALLEELLQRPNSPPLLFIICHRDMGEEAPSPALVLLEKTLAITGTTWSRIALPSLAPEDARRLADAMLPPGGDRALQVETLLRESHGSPLFLRQLAERVISQGAAWKSSPVELPVIIREQVADLPPASSNLVELLSIAGRPLLRELALEVAGIGSGGGGGDGGGVSPTTLLRAVNTHLLLTRSTSSGVLLEPAHDKVRESVVSGLAPDRAKFWHRRLAETLRQLPSPDPEVLVEHYLGAGENAEAGRFALHAAKHANDVLAFDRAAEHLALALEMHNDDDDNDDDGMTPRPQLLSLRAEALANAGRGGEAADCYRDAAALLEGAATAATKKKRKKTDPSTERQEDDVLVLRRKAGEHYLRSGRIDDGMAAMNEVLAQIGIALPTSRERALASMAVKRARLLLRGIDFEERDPASISSVKLARLDALWSATTSISMLNFVVADPLGVEHLLEALAAGVSSHVIRGLGYEAAFEAVLGGKFFNARCRRLLDRMDQMAEQSAVPYDQAWARMSRGITSWSLGDFATVVSMCDEAEGLYRGRCRGVAWELAVVDAFCLQSLASLGRIAELSRRVPHRLRAAEERGDLFAANILRLGHPNMIHLAAGEPGRALDEAMRGFAPIPKETYITPHYHFLLASCQAELYQGEGWRAFERIESDWPRLKSAQFLRAQCLRLEIRHLRARAALAAAAATGGPPGGAQPRSEKTLHRTKARSWTRKRLLDCASAEANVLRRDGLPLGAAYGDLIRAGVARLNGNRDEALARLGECIERFDGLRLHLYREATRYCHGLVLGGDAGRASIQASTEWMRSEQIADPAAMTGMLVPGFLAS